MNRDLMGATNPSKTAKGQLGDRFASEIQENAVHGSDSLESASREIAFFSPKELGCHSLNSQQRAQNNIVLFLALKRFERQLKLK